MLVYHVAPIISKGVIILYHEAFGLTGHFKNLCNKLAHEGYIVYAPELLYRQGPHFVINHKDKVKLQEGIKNFTRDTLLADIDQVLIFVKQRENIGESEISTIGFSIGGYISLLTGTCYNTLGSVSFYGAGIGVDRLDLPYKALGEELSRIKGKVLLFYGEDDYSVTKEDRGRTLKYLEKGGVKVRSKTFKNCNHNFFCNQRRSYNKEAAMKAWTMLIKWLNQVHKKTKILTKFYYYFIVFNLT